MNTMTNIIADRALIDGLIPLLAMPYMVIDKLDTPFPDVKQDMAKSSIDRVKDIKAPAKIPFLIFGIKTFLIAYDGVAPRSRAASIIFLSMASTAGNTVKTTYGIQNIMWDKIMVI